MVLEGSYSEEVQAMQHELEPLLGLSEQQMSPEDLLRVQTFRDLQIGEQRENPALRVMIHRGSEVLADRYSRLEVDPERLFHYLGNLGVPSDKIPSTYFRFGVLPSGAFSPKTDQPMISASVSLVRPFANARSIAQKKVQAQEKEVIAAGQARDNDWLNNWRHKQTRFELSKVLQAEVSRELARTCFKAVDVANGGRLSRRERVAQKAATGFAFGSAAVITGSRMERYGVPSGIAAMFFTGMMSISGLGLAARTRVVSPLQAGAQAFAARSVEDPKTARELADIFKVSPGACESSL